MRVRTAICLGVLLSSGAFGAPAAYRDVFAYPPPSGRGGQFRSLLAKTGPGGALRHVHLLPNGIVKARKDFEAAEKTYRKLGDKWWGWRAKFEKSYLRKHKRPPVEYPTPQGINRSYMDSELAFKEARNTLFQERLFRQAVYSHIGAALKADHGKKALAGLKTALGAKDVYTRVRAARLLEHLPDEVAAEVAQAAGAKEKHGAVLATLIRFMTPAGAHSFVMHPSWVARAAAVRRTRDKDALRNRLAAERGFVRGEIEAALGEKRTNPVPWFGREVSTRGVVLCVETTSAASWPQLQEIVGKTLDAIKDGSSFGLVAMGRETTVFKKKLTAMNAGVRAAAKKWLAAIQPAGFARIHEGFMKSFQLAGGERNKPPAADTVLFFALRPPSEPSTERNWIRFADGRQIATEIEPEAAIRGVRVHTYGPSGGGDSFYLQAITKHNGTHRGRE